MGPYAARRLLQAIPTLLGVAIIAFLLTEASGDPVRAMMGERVSPEILRRVKEHYGYDDDNKIKSKLNRFLGYMTRTATGDLGVSITSHGQPVREMIQSGMKVTLKLALGAILIASTLGITLGVLSAWRPNSWIDYSSSAFSALGVSFPAFFLAMLFMLLFSVKLDWLPVGGYQEGEMKYLILPCCSLGLLSTAGIARLTRNCMLESMGQDYIRTGRAKGLKEAQVLLNHGLPNALIPILTVVGNDFAGLLTGAILTETVYGLPGIGSVLSTAIFGRDLPVVIGCTLVLALIFVAANLIVDMCYSALDPRIRLQ